MDVREQERYYDLGKEYWWLKGKYKIIDSFIKLFSKRFIKNSVNINILDYGCGPGNMLDYLSKYGMVYGIDYSEKAIEFCRLRGYLNTLAEKTLPIKFPNNHFDIITSIDVLEHIEDDSAVIAELFRLLKPGGLLFVTVPAFQILWGAHDEIYGHKRRYLKKYIVKKFELNNMIVIKSTYFEFIFFFPLLFARTIKKIILWKNNKKDDFYPVPSIINKFLTWMIFCEYYCIKYFNMPLGPTLLIVAQKKNE